jgi:hypothetical protein
MKRYIKRHIRCVRKSYKHSGTWSHANEQPTAQCVNDLMRTGLLLVLLGLFALIIPVLKTRHSILAVLAPQPTHQTQSDHADSHTISPAIVEGAMGVGSMLVGAGLWVRR